MNSSPEIDKLAPALLAAQQAVCSPRIDSTAKTDKYSYRYASLPEVRNAIVPIFLSQGLAIVQVPGVGDRGPRLVTRLIHSSGQWIEVGEVELPAARQDPQGYGSALTYARRYSLLCAAAIAPDEDDDGAAAMPQQQARQQAQASTAQQHGGQAPTQRGQQARRPTAPRARQGDPLARAQHDMLDLVRLAESHGYAEHHLLDWYGLQRLDQMTIEQYQHAVSGFRELAARKAAGTRQSAGTR